MTRRTWTRCLAVLLASAIVAAGCGGDGDEPRPVETAAATSGPESGASDTADPSGQAGSEGDSPALDEDAAEEPEAEAEPLLAPVDTTTTTTPRRRGRSRRPAARFGWLSRPRATA